MKAEVRTSGNEADVGGAKEAEEAGWEGRPYAALR